ncbi:hypothetical protein PoB_002851100 [Plakobranchus ocellatus]|uniref:Uncharacterized protein n=1 Tax=Plakobranchus ocellatus TaxID=259542 RepID=A0AAV3ZSJ1_9GAST|nr:hypothetical protein PoB_002851100 [Plakobranchus ocellatus]
MTAKENIENEPECRPDRDGWVIDAQRWSKHPKAKVMKRFRWRAILQYRVQKTDYGGHDAAAHNGDYTMISAALSLYLFSPRQVRVLPPVAISGLHLVSPDIFLGNNGQGLLKK